MWNYGREFHRQPGWPPWIPPSPGIVSWETAGCYTALVFLEAFPSIDHGRAAGLPFQLLAADWIDGAALARELNARSLPGCLFHPHLCQIRNPGGEPGIAVGVRLSLPAPDAFRPIRTSLHIVHALQTIHGAEKLWNSPGARPGFFDKLYGCAAVRTALAAGADPDVFAGSWEDGLARFRASRTRHRLYPLP
jgi:uncharacterized protein YbbC (DUF1343 family)